MNELHFGVSVGIDRYPGVSDASDLSFARTDAESFHDWLVSPGGGAVPVDNATLLKGKPRRGYPTQKDLHDTLAGCHRAVTGLKPGSSSWEETRLYVYGAGHGYGPTDGTAALLLADARDDALGYHFEIQRYLLWLTVNAPFKEVLLFTDCCRRRYADGPASATVPFNGRDLKPPVEVCALVGYAARRDELAFEPKNPATPDEARGIFTRAVLDGLAGSAANDGVVTSASLATYVRSTVENVTRNRRVPQKVEFSADPSQRIDICAPQDPAPLRTLTIAFAPNAHGEAVIKDGSFHVIEKHQIAAGDLTVQLEDGFYLLELGENSGGFTPRRINVNRDARVDA